MSDAQIRYDEPSDTLYVSFAPGEAATGLELSDHILLRVDKGSRCAIGITLFDFSLLAQQTDLGPRSFPLSGLARLTPELRELAGVAATVRAGERVPLALRVQPNGERDDFHHGAPSGNDRPARGLTPTYVPCR